MPISLVVKGHDLVQQPLHSTIDNPRPLHHVLLTSSEVFS